MATRSELRRDIRKAAETRKHVRALHERLQGVDKKTWKPAPEDENLLSLGWVTGLPGPTITLATRAESVELYLALADAKLGDRIILLQREYQGGEVEGFYEFDFSWITRSRLRPGFGSAAMAFLLIPLGAMFGFFAVMVPDLRNQRRVSTAIIAALLLVGGGWLATRAVKRFRRS
jgi:hypothetical protein